MPSPMGCAEGLAPCLIGEFSAIRQYCGSENSLISYGIFFVNTLRRAACLPVTIPYFSPFGRWWATGRSFPFSKAFLHEAVGCKV